MYKGRDYQKQKRGSEIDKVIKKINGIKNLEDLAVKDFASQGGYADKIARELKGKLNPTQLRKFFDAVNRIKKRLKKESWHDVENDFYLLQPQLAYAAGRKVGKHPIIPADFYELMNVCMQKIAPQNIDDEQKKKNFRRFAEFFEAIVAYHKYREEVS